MKSLELRPLMFKMREKPFGYMLTEARAYPPLRSIRSFNSLRKASTSWKSR
jgi:hypothetical protein